MRTDSQIVGFMGFHCTERRFFDTQWRLDCQNLVNRPPRRGMIAYVIVNGVLATLAKGLGRVAMLPPGRSNSLGALGSMRAVFELSDQVERGEMPRPDSIFVPIGTGGTAVGLAVGLLAPGWNAPSRAASRHLY